MRVLIVESNEQSRKEISQFYRSKNYSPIFVESAFFALKMLALNEFDLVVTGFDVTTANDFYNQVKALSNARVMCTAEVGVIGTPTHNAGHVLERQKLSLIN